MTRLTPQLSASSPNDFRQELITGLSKRTVYGRQLWGAVVNAGLVNIDALHIESGTWFSRSNAQKGYIHLGAQALSGGERKRLLFNDPRVNYEQEVNLRLLHEIGHLFEASRRQAGSDRIHDLLNTAAAVRSVNQSLGLTAIGSQPLYKPAVKFHEDGAELMAMYAFDPGYLRDFLAHVDNPSSAAMLSNVGIAVVPGHGNEIFQLVEDAVQEGISA